MDNYLIKIVCIFKNADISDDDDSFIRQQKLDEAEVVVRNRWIPIYDIVGIEEATNQSKYELETENLYLLYLSSGPSTHIVLQNVEEFLKEWSEYLTIQHSRG